MVHRYSLKNKVVRAGFYVTSIGGLMMLFAGLLWVCWNHLISDRLQYAPLSFLESVGLVSIAYIVYSSLRFSSQVDDCGEEQEPDLTIHQQKNPSAPSAGDSQRRVTELNGAQREQLKHEIERCCGKRAVEPMTQPGVEHPQA